MKNDKPSVFIIVITLLVGYATYLMYILSFYISPAICVVCKIKSEYLFNSFYSLRF